MDFNQWLSALKQEIVTSPLIQWAGILFNVAEVLFARANKVWLYPCGLIGVSIFMITLFQVNLYAEALLNLYYLVMTLYGWVLWSSTSTQPLKVSYSTGTEWIISLLILVTSLGILYVLLKYYTDSQVPLWDSWVSATAWAGMWLLAQRKIENWIFLNISNISSIPLLMQKGLPLYSLLTIFFFFMGVLGYFHWKKIIESTTPR